MNIQETYQKQIRKIEAIFPKLRVAELIFRDIENGHDPDLPKIFRRAQSRPKEKYLIIKFKS
jgi:hypothetical protein